MLRDEAINISNVKLAYRIKAAGGYMFWDGETIWTQKTDTGEIVKWNAALDNQDDWEPLDNVDILSIFVNKSGDIPPAQYEEMLAKSPIGMIYRQGKKGEYHVYNGFYYKQKGNNLEKINIPANSYKDWWPLNNDHILATLNYDSNIVKFKDSDIRNKDIVLPEIITAVGPMAQAIAAVAASMMEIGEKEVATSLAKSLARLVDNASWHLREDRSKYQ